MDIHTVIDRQRDKKINYDGKKDNEKDMKRQILIDESTRCIQ